MESVWQYAIVLLMFGAALGIADVTMNINAIHVEIAVKRRLMSSMQAFWSIGCLTGVGCFTLLASLGLSALMIAVVHALIILATVGYYGRGWLSHQSSGKSKTFAVPRGIVIIFGIVMGVLFLAEGAIRDWGGIFLTEEKQLDLSLAGIGYALFSAATLIMRLLGDKIVQRLGEKTMLYGGTILAAGGAAILVCSDDIYLSGVSFALIGIGCANIIPIIYSMLKHQQAMPIGDAIAAICSMGYTGVILGPAFLGFIAEWFGIGAVFELLVGLMLIEALLAKYIFSHLRR